MALRDVLVKLGVQVLGAEKLDQVNRQLQETNRHVRAASFAFRGLAAIWAAGALVRGVRDFVQEQITLADSLQHQSERLGITTDELQKYQYVAGLMGVSTKETAIGLRFFNRAVGEAALGTKAATKTFAHLGIAVKGADGQVRPTGELLFEFADKLKGVHSQAERTAIAMRTLGRNGAALLPALQNGSEELRQMMKDVDDLGGGFDETFVKEAHKVDVQQKRLAMGWRTIHVAIAKEVLPVIAKMLESSIRTVKVLIDFAKHTYGVRTALVALVATIGVISAAIGAWLLITNPGLILLGVLVAAAVVLFAGLYLVLDDLYTFMQGGDSILGRFLDKLGGVGTAKAVWRELTGAIQAVRDALKESGLSMDDVKTGFKEFLGTIPAIVKWGGVFTTFVLDVINHAVTFFENLSDKMTQFSLDAAALFGGETDKAASDAAQKKIDERNAARDKRSEALQQLTRAFDSFDTPITRSAKPGSEFAVGSPSAGELDPGRSTGGKSTPMSVTVNQTFHNAADPKAVGKAASQGVEAGVKNAHTKNRDAFAAVTAGSPAL